MPLPALAALLIKAGTPLLANAAIAKGKQWLEEKTGVKINEGADISSDDAAKLRQYELENESELARLRVEDNRIAAELDKAYLGDVQDARNRDIEFAKLGRTNERANHLAYLAVGGFLGIAFLLLLGQRLGITIDPATRELLMYVLGSLNTLVVMVYSFDFGSSKDAAKMGNAMTKWLDKE